MNKEQAARFRKLLVEIDQEMIAEWERRNWIRFLLCAPFMGLYLLFALILRIVVWIFFG